MAKYYIHTEKDSYGDNEVHVDTCAHLPGVATREYIGDLGNCQDAVKAAKPKYPKADGCYWCSRPCHNH
jgi:hypothetical protein